jgi:hypothetical protein
LLSSSDEGSSGLYAIAGPNVKGVTVDGCGSHPHEGKIPSTMKPASRWDDAIQPMLARMRDTADRVGNRFPHWTNPDNKRADSRPQDAASSCEFIVGSYYLLETLLVLSGALDPIQI